MSNETKKLEAEGSSTQDGTPLTTRPLPTLRARGQRSRWLKSLLTRAWIYLALAILYVLFGLITPNHVFFTGEVIGNILVDGSVLLILAIGATYVIIAGEIDLSIGSILVLSSVVAAKVMAAVSPAGDGSSPLVAILLGLLSGLIVGAGMGALNALLVLNARIPSFLVTLGTLSIGLGLAQVISHGVDIVDVPASLQANFGVAKLVGIPTIVVLGLGTCAVFGLVLAQTRLGRHTYAIGSSAEASIRAGVPVRRHLVGIFVISGLLASLAGFVDLSRFGTTNVSGHTTDALLAIAAVAIGGASIYGGSGSMAGTLVGVFIPVLIADGLIIKGIQPFWQTVAVGALILIAVGIDIRQRGSEPQRH